MTIGLVLGLWAVGAGLWLWWPRRSRDVDYVSERWQRDHIYRNGKS